MPYQTILNRVSWGWSLKLVMVPGRALRWRSIRSSINWPLSLLVSDWNGSLMMNPSRWSSCPDFNSSANRSVIISAAKIGSCKFTRVDPRAIFLEFFPLAAALPVSLSSSSFFFKKKTQIISTTDRIKVEMPLIKKDDLCDWVNSRQEKAFFSPCYVIINQDWFKRLMNYKNMFRSYRIEATPAFALVLRLFFFFVLCFLFDV